MTDVISRECEKCKHRRTTNNGLFEFVSCNAWECHFEPKEENANNDKWILLDSESPQYNTLILLSFENYPVPAIGELREDDKFYLSDSYTPLRARGIFVNAWQPLPKCLHGRTK